MLYMPESLLSGNFQKRPWISVITDHQNYEAFFKNMEEYGKIANFQMCECRIREVPDT